MIPVEGAGLRGANSVRFNRVRQAQQQGCFPAPALLGGVEQRISPGDKFEKEVEGSLQEKGAQRRKRVAGSAFLQRADELKERPRGVRATDRLDADGEGSQLDLHAAPSDVDLHHTRARRGHAFQDPCHIRGHDPRAGSQVDQPKVCAGHARQRAQDFCPCHALLVSAEVQGRERAQDAGHDTPPVPVHAAAQGEHDQGQGALLAAPRQHDLDLRGHGCSRAELFDFSRAELF
jgi:hypothetical protein